MDSLGSNHSIPSMSVSTGSQSSSVSSMQEVLDESSPELVMMHSDESTINSTSSVVHKKVRSLVLSIAPRSPCCRSCRLTQRSVCCELVLSHLLRAGAGAGIATIKFCVVGFFFFKS